MTRTAAQQSLMEALTEKREELHAARAAVVSLTKQRDEALNDAHAARNDAQGHLLEVESLRRDLRDALTVRDELLTAIAYIATTPDPTAADHCRAVLRHYDHDGSSVPLPFNMREA